MTAVRVHLDSVNRFATAILGRVGEKGRRGNASASLHIIAAITYGLWERRLWYGQVETRQSTQWLQIRVGAGIRAWDICFSSQANPSRTPRCIKLPRLAVLWLRV